MTGTHYTINFEKTEPKLTICSTKGLHNQEFYTIGTCILSNTSCSFSFVHLYFSSLFMGIDEYVYIIVDIASYNIKLKTDQCMIVVRITAS